MNNQTNPFQPKPQVKPQVSHANFIEALKSAGGAQVSDIKRGVTQDLIGGMGKQIGDTIFNRNSSSSVLSEQQADQNPFDFGEFLHSNDNKEQRPQFSASIQEIKSRETVLYNSRQEEVDKKIAQLQHEIQLLAKEIVHLDQDIQTAVAQRIPNGGIAHINYLEKLITFISQLRKNVAKSRNWAMLANQRNGAKSYFWNNANQKIGGTSFSQSQERSVAISTG
jgi:hypothetical protein